MNDNIFEKIVDKIFSGSFSMLVLVGATYCIIMLACVWLAAKGKIPMNEFLILIGGLGTTFMALWKDYTGTKQNQTNGKAKEGEINGTTKTTTNNNNGSNGPVASDDIKS